MILISKILSVCDPSLLENKKLDYFELEWYETSKRIIRKKTVLGTDLALKRSNTEALNQDDILFIDDKNAILVSILSCECIALTPKSMIEMGSICYDIGNKHIPIFLEDNKVLIPYDKPSFEQFEKLGYEPVLTQQKLTNALRTNIPQHGHFAEKEVFFNKIMLLTQ
jgi:urease accessory protein